MTMEVKRMLINVRTKVSTYVIAVAVFCCVDTALAQTSNERTLHAPDSSSTLSVGSRDYVISPDDLLDIFIVDVPELSRQYRISTSGELNFPLFRRRSAQGVLRFRPRPRGWRNCCRDQVRLTIRGLPSGVRRRGSTSFRSPG